MVLTGGMNTNRATIVQLLTDAIAMNQAADADAFDIEVAADAILAGQVPPDIREGLITDSLEARVFCAIMNDGPWWK